MSENLISISSKAPMPLMFHTVAKQFESLRRDTRLLTGRDFLGTLGDCFREADLRSKKDGVAFRSNHKTGRAFDYDQTAGYLLIERDPQSLGKMMFRTFIVCDPQDGSKGVRMTVRDYRGYAKEAYVVDFTALAEEHGFSRIPAWRGWEKNYNRREFWHYEDMTENGRRLTWDEAMLAIKGKTREPEKKIYGLNDRGPEVLAIQQRLADKGMLPMIEVDGIFGEKTQAAIKEFQKSVKIDQDGLVGPTTRSHLFK